jgi:hypothetical protein
MKPLRALFFLGIISFALGCESGPAGKNLVDGTVPKKDGYQPREQDNRLPHERRLDDQINYPWKGR